jgi:beta-galactosidase
VDRISLHSHRRWIHPFAPGQEYQFIERVRVINPRLWLVEAPYLYTVQSVIRNGEDVVVRYETPFGIRKVEFDADCGFLLNDQHVKISGVCLHHDDGCVGSAVPARVWERRLEIMKLMGCNGIHSSHYPPAPEFLDICDRMGFRVMDENFDEWKIGKFLFGYHDYFNQWAIADTVSMVRRDRNHPSVVMWSVGNEIPEQMVPGGVKILRQLIDVVH